MTRNAQETDRARYDPNGSTGPKPQHDKTNKNITVYEQVQQKRVCGFHLPGVCICFQSTPLSKLLISITKTCIYNVDPIKPHFHIVKLGFTRYTLFFLFLLKHRLWVLVRTASARPTSTDNLCFWAETWKISEVLSENFHFWVVKLSVYLNRLVFVMIARKGHS